MTQLAQPKRVQKDNFSAAIFLSAQHCDKPELLLALQNKMIHFPQHKRNKTQIVSVWRANKIGKTMRSKKNDTADAVCFCDSAFPFHQQKLCQERTTFLFCGKPWFLQLQIMQSHLSLEEKQCSNTHWTTGLLIWWPLITSTLAEVWCKCQASLTQLFCHPQSDIFPLLHHGWWAVNSTKTHFPAVIFQVGVVTQPDSDWTHWQCCLREARRKGNEKAATEILHPHCCFLSETPNNVWPRNCH